MVPSPLPTLSEVVADSVPFSTVFPVTTKVPSDFNTFPACIVAPDINPSPFPTLHDVVADNVLFKVVLPVTTRVVFASKPLNLPVLRVAFPIAVPSIAPPVIEQTAVTILPLAAISNNDSSAEFITDKKLELCSA